MSEKLDTKWLDDELISFEDDKDFEDELEDYHDLNRKKAKSSFDYFFKGLEELIKEWEEWKKQ